MTNTCCFCNREISEHSQACGTCARRGTMASIGYGNSAIPSFYESESERLNKMRPKL